MPFVLHDEFFCLQDVVVEIDFVALKVPTDDGHPITTVMAFSTDVVLTPSAILHHKHRHYCAVE